MKADSEGWDPTNPFETERILGECLRGVRLVGELDLSQEQGIFAMARSVVLGATRATGDYRRLNSYPAATAVFLAAEGTRAYDEGTFWPNLELKGNRGQPMFGPHDRLLNASDQSRIGSAFLNAVQELQLESFEGIGESERWLTYVTPILLHGGIPSAYAEKTAALVLQGMGEGLDEASELIERLLSPQGRAGQIPKPLERFLAYGGDFAVDLVQRMMALALDAAAVGGEVARNLIAEMAEDSGLPHYLAEALLNGSPLPPVIRPGTPRPWICIDPYSCHGPFVTFPPVSGLPGASWVLIGSASSRIPASQHDSRDVPLTPFREWGVVLEAEDLRSETTFSGLRDAAAYIFDGDGRLAKRQRHLKWPSALVLAANETQLLDEAGSPVPLAEELPPRAGAWTGWKLLRVDTSETRALQLVSEVPDTPGLVQVPVRRPPPAPSIATVPLPGVTGPDGCPVYSDPPIVREADTTDVRSWRVRWRSDGDAGPPPTAFLDSLPKRPNGRDLSPRLPDRAAFVGTIEVVGPLGSDMRERVAVVRGLIVESPDRVVGPDETVRATVSASCQFGPAEDSSAGSVTLTFGPGQDTAALTAGDVALTLTIPRLAWAVQRRDGAAPPTIVGELQHIGLDEIESGEVETLIVRCGRPAEIRLELWRDNNCLQEATPKRASGDQGRWAFPLAQFRTTAADSGFATMRLILHADGTSAEAAVIQARYEVSDLKIDSLPDGFGLAVLQATWNENKPFRNRLLRLWSQHRPWEAPVVVDIPDDAGGCVDALIETAPGPYVAEIAVGDWGNPQRPSEGAENCVNARIGTGADERARLATLRAANPLDALELIISSRARPPLPEGVSVVGVRDELAQALAACCDDALMGRAFDGLVELALSEEGLLANLLVGDLRWSLPERSFGRLVLFLVPVILDRRPAAYSETLRRLWQSAPLAAAAFDSACDEDAESRWKRFTGWIPRPGVVGPEQPDQPVSKPLDEWCPDRLRNLAAAIPPMESLPLQFGGYRDAAFEMLERSWPDRGQINGWRAAHNRVCTYIQRLGHQQHHHLEQLRPPDGSPGWHKFPADVLAASFQLVDEFGSDDRSAAARALMESYDIAPRLTERSVLLAIALRIAEHSCE